MAAQAAPPEMPTFVSLAQAQEVSFRQSSSAIGTIVAPQSISLRNEIAGTVSHVNLSAGSIVEEGTILLQLDTSIEVAQLASAKSAAKMSQSKYQRTRDAFRASALTAAELEEAENELTQAGARVAELEAQIRRKTLTAPFRAQVGLSDTHLGQYLPSGTEIASLQGVQDYKYIDFTIPQMVAQAASIGQVVTIATSQTNYSATIEAFDSRADKLTRNLMARAKLSSAPPLMKPGDSVKVLIEYGPEIHAVAIPSEALRRTPSGAQVFVTITDDQGKLRASQRTVQVVQTLGGRVAINSGVQAGETVVASGSFKLINGGLLQELTGENVVGAPQTNNTP